MSGATKGSMSSRTPIHSSAGKKAAGSVAGSAGCVGPKCGLTISDVAGGWLWSSSVPSGSGGPDQMVWIWQSLSSRKASFRPRGGGSRK